MIQIEIQNLDSVSRTLDNWVQGVETQATTKLKGTAVKALQWLTRHSPQFTGDFAANWKVAINGYDYSFDVGAVDAKWVDPRGSAFGMDAYKQGDQPAISYALAEGLPKLAKAKIGDFITISNSALHDEAYAWKIENNEIKFREENVEGGRVIARFLESFRSLPA